MVRFPRGWGRYFHPQASRPAPSAFAYRPGWRGTGMQPMTAVPIQRYTARITGVPLTGGQQQGTVQGSGKASLSVGPQGLGTIWYPTQVTISTTTGPLDASTALVYLGAQGVPITLVASVFTGNGTIGLAIPTMSPGQVLIVSWTGAQPGDVVSMNIVGTMDALTTG
jgi:hypothetical protein